MSTYINNCQIGVIADNAKLLVTDPLNIKNAAKYGVLVKNHATFEANKIDGPDVLILQDCNISVIVCNQSVANINGAQITETYQGVIYDNSNGYVVNSTISAIDGIDSSTRLYNAVLSQNSSVFLANSTANGFGSATSGVPNYPTSWRASFGGKIQVLSTVNPTVSDISTDLGGFAAEIVEVTVPLSRDGESVFLLPPDVLSYS